MGVQSPSPPNQNQRVYLYTGSESVVPRNIRRVRVIGVGILPKQSFQQLNRLEDVQLPEGLEEISAAAFYFCTSLRTINFPASLKHIGDSALAGTSLEQIQLPQGLRTISPCAFKSCKIYRLTVPRHLAFSAFSFQDCRGLLSLELPKTMNKVCSRSFIGASSLRNLSIPTSCEIGICAFGNCHDMRELCPSDVQIERALKGRYDNLPIHNLVYYQPYQEERKTTKKLRKILGERSSWNIGKSSLAAVEQVDCFGFNPLHALACSSRQSLDVYRMIVERHPANLIGKDLWGETPFTYVFWSDAPHEVVQYMLRCYRHKFPGGFGVDWNHMLYTLCLGNAPIGGLDKLCEYGHVDLDTMAGRLARPVHSREVKTSSRKTFKFIVERSLADRLSAVSVRRWREEIAREIELIPEDCHGLPSTKRRVHLDKIQSILLKYEKLDASVKEATVSLELALWKIKLYECSRYQMGDDREQESNEERTLDRQEIRLSCGSDVVIENTLPFLIGP
mmetsp:Transcript_17985/g.41966  ORF Transcript_17985/g.41966 Transcript_17985/m.41966 type:complete len:506 (+) Transcript_17985:278-1795(+)